MPSHLLVSFLLLLLQVPFAASLQQDAGILSQQWPLKHADGLAHELLADSDSCLSAGKQDPVSLLQVGAESKRVLAKPRVPSEPENTASVRGGSPTIHSLAVPLGSAVRLDKKFALQTSVERRTHHSQKEVAALQAHTSSGGGGDAIQGLIFSVFVLLIVAGIYCVIVREAWPGGDFDSVLRSDSPLLRTDNLLKRPFNRPLFPGGGPAASRLPTGMLTDTALPQRPNPQEQRPSMFRTADMGENAELPIICEELIMPVAHTRLAVPVESLGQSNFEVDVLGLSGVPLLSAKQVDRRDVTISLHNVSTLIAVVTSEMEICTLRGHQIGRIMKESGSPAVLKYVLRNRLGQAILTLTSMGPESRDFKMTSMSAGRIVERATAVRRPRGKLPAEHYEIVANPNVDGVLALACFLAVAVFDQHNEITGSAFKLPDTAGRPSTDPTRPGSLSLMQLYP